MLQCLPYSFIIQQNPHFFKTCKAIRCLIYLGNIRERWDLLQNMMGHMMLDKPLQETGFRQEDLESLDEIIKEHCAVVWFCTMLFFLLSGVSLKQVLIISVHTDRLVGRTDNLSIVCQLLHTVSAPAHNSGNGKNRGIQFHRQIKHTVHETRIEVHVDVDTLVDWTLLRN